MPVKLPMKLCPDCAREGMGEKPVTAFGVARGRADGRQTYCKYHHWQRQVQTRLKNRARYEERKAAGEIV